MLGDEAYLSLTLPVSIGEHLWGRYLADLVWAASYGITILFSVFLVAIRKWHEIRFSRFFEDIMTTLNEFKVIHGYSLAYMIFMILLNALVFFMLICVFSYMTESILQLIGKHKTLFSILIFAGIFIIFTNFFQICVDSFIDDYSVFKTQFMVIPLIYNICWMLLFSVITRLILTYKLNLE